MKLEGKFITELLEQLVKIPSPSGYTKEIITFCQNILQTKGIETSLTNNGSLMATIPGENSSKHRLLTAHVDTLGAMVKKIKSNGRLYLSKIGVFEWNSVEGDYCNIHTMDDEVFTGTIQTKQTFVHSRQDAGKVASDDCNIEVRIDAKVSTREEVESLGIQVGDFVSFEPRFGLTEEGFIKSRHLDSKASVALLLHMLDKIHNEQITLPYTTHFYLSNNQESGFRENASIAKEINEHVAVDMGVVGEGQSSNEFNVSICAKDSSGPYHYPLRRQLVKLADKYRLGYQVDVYSHYRSYASNVILAGSDTRHALVGPSIDAPHSFQRTHVDSLLNTLRLLQHYLQSEMN